jgi:alpha-glucosidase
MLELYRTALGIRRSESGLGDGAMTWRAAPDGVLAFDRGPDVLCVANLSDGPVALPGHAEVLLASGPLTDGQLPADTAVWLRTGALG